MAHLRHLTITMNAASHISRKCALRRARSSPIDRLVLSHCPVRSMATSAANAESFAARLLAAPHRDATHVPYGDWFTLYVQLRKEWKAQATTASPSSAQTPEFQQKTKRAVDALLWNSLFARHWSEVQVPLAASTSTSPLSATSSHYRWWWHTQARFNEAADNTTTAPLELCTADFLTEPLLGGRHLRLWMEDVRASATATATRADDVASRAGGNSTVPTVLIPFSTVWAIKRSAYWRPAAAAAGAAASPLSLQERQARQALLQTIDLLLQLQCDAAATAQDDSASSSQPGNGAPIGQLQRLCVLSPTQEWDLMCRVPQFRQLLHPSTAPIPQPPWLSIGALCEDTTARLAYCAHVLTWQRRSSSLQAGGEEAEEASAAAAVVRVLSPASDHARLRSFALTAVHEQSIERPALDRRHAARHQSAVSGQSPSGSVAATVHGQARKGCSDAVRRMAHREENIRQSFSVR